MKRIFLIMLLVSVAIAGDAQVRPVQSKVIPKETPVIKSTVIPAKVRDTAKLLVVNTVTAMPNYTEGKDLKIAIDRIEDKSTFDLNKYTVCYTVTNWGTEQLNLGYYISVNGTFLTSDGSLFCTGGESALPQNNSWLQSGQTIKGSMDIIAPKLKTGVTYKYILKIDGKNHITEGDENNNTAESTITGRAIKDADYYLASAKVTIQTGNDNKEANNSLVYFYLGPANYNESSYLGIGNWVDGTGYAAEIKINSTTEITLPYRMLGNLPNNTLCFYKQRGVALTIIYDNKLWKSDAWKVNNISITLYFKDRNGNPYPHPSFASKTINIPNSAGILGYRLGDDLLNNANQMRMLTVGTDQNFSPLAPIFKKLGPNNRFSVLVLENSPTFNKPVNECY